jgi:ribosome recycling factor
VPGPPTDVKVQPVNSSTIHVQWRPPTEEDRHGIIRGYHIHVQEAKPEVPNLSQRINEGTLTYVLSRFLMIFIDIFRGLG